MSLMNFTEPSANATLPPRLEARRDLVVGFAREGTRARLALRVRREIRVREIQQEVARLHRSRSGPVTLLLALGETIPGSRALAPGLMISRAVPRCDRRQAVTAQPHPVGSPVATGGGTVLTTMSHPMAQRCAHDLVLRSLPGRCPSQHAGHLSGFGCVPGRSPGVAPDGDHVRSPPPQPHRDDASGSTRGERRSRRRHQALRSRPQIRVWALRALASVS